MILQGQVKEPFLTRLGNFLTNPVGGMVSSVVGGLGSTLFSNMLNMRNWNKMNDYNSPAAQIQRLQEAGINPAAMHSLNSGNASAVQPVQRVEVPNTLSVMQNYVDTRAKIAQTNNLEAQNESIRLDNLFKKESIQERIKAVLLENYLRSTREGLTNQKWSSEIENTYEKRLKNIQLGSWIDNPSYVNPYELSARSTLSKTQLQIQQYLQRELMNPLDRQIQSFAARMAEQNMRPGDSLYLRLLSNWYPDMSSGMRLGHYIGSQTVLEAPKWIGGLGIAKGLKSFKSPKNDFSGGSYFIKGKIFEK